MSFLPTEEVDEELKIINSDEKVFSTVLTPPTLFSFKRKGCLCIQKLSPPLSSQTPQFLFEIYKKISTLMLAPDTVCFLFDFTTSPCFDKFKDQPLEVCVSNNGDYETQNRIVYIHFMPPHRSTLVLKSLSPRWLSSHNTIRTYVEVMGDVSGLKALPQELIEEIVSRTRPVDTCGKLSIVSRSFQSAAKSDHVWERFLPADLISRRAKSNESHDWIFVEDPWKKIDSDTLQAFPTKKDLYLFLSDNPLIIDDGDMYFWLDKLSGNKCFHLVPEKLSIPEPDGYCGVYDYIQLTLPFKIEGKISTSLLSPNIGYTAYLLFDFTSSHYFSGFGEEEPLQTCVGIDGGCESESEVRIVYIPFMPTEYQRGTKILKCRPPEMPILSGPQYPRRRDDGWYELELGGYFNKEGGGDNRELKMCLSEVKTGDKGGIDLRGIEIRPKNCQKNQS